MSGCKPDWLSFFVLLALIPLPVRVPASEFLVHCDAEPIACKSKVLAYIKFLVDGNMLDRCVMQMPADGVVEKVLTWMRNHPEKGGQEWTDCLDSALAALDLCRK
jgi:hypothetical protein